ncbi:type VI secretion system baseplate subunit TssE [Pseudomonas japonica]|uniref:Type VI secretion system protein n=1 Tax=Pseudomonas japonica TaxID=256466 RepID=A0A239CNM6_9PSED|nr:type VI secretion system baseplate subunit TssE [Pseudomonas japonica]SNS21094.1 type VI secretion system protein [Pseudomonas japonica]
MIGNPANTSVAGAASLFQRLDPNLSPRRSRSRQGLAAERILAIKTNLEQLLNTRRGSSQSCPGLGLPDMNDAAAGQLELRNQICQEIREMLTLHEPRVRVVDVRPLAADEQPLGLCFRLHCHVPLADAAEQVEIDLLVHQRQQRIQVL